METSQETCESVGPAAFEPAPNAIRNRLGLLLYRTGQGLLGYCEDDLDRLGLDGRDYMALAILDEELPRSQLELAQLTGKAPAMIVGIVDALEKAGFAQRDRDPADRRRSVVTITPAGREALANADALARASEHAILAGLDPDERAQLHALLQRAVAPATPATEAASTADAPPVPVG